MQKPLFEVPEHRGEKPTGDEGEARVATPDRTQTTLKTFDFETLVEEDHPARAVRALTEGLDLGAYHAAIQARGSKAGRSATDPKLLVALWPYATIDGVGSARRLERLTKSHDAYKWAVRRRERESPRSERFGCGFVKTTGNPGVLEKKSKCEPARRGSYGIADIIAPEDGSRWQRTRRWRRLTSFRRRATSSTRWSRNWARNERWGSITRPSRHCSKSAGAK
jgi:transposase